MTDTTRLRRAIEPILERCLDFFGEDDLDPESSEAMPVVIKNRWVYALRAALAARPDSPTLDVERLARALTVLRVRLEAAALAGKPVWQDDASFAETIAHEYAALAPSSEDER